MWVLLYFVNDVVYSVFLQKASDHELEEMFYDKFEMTLDDVQVMIMKSGELMFGKSNINGQVFVFNEHVVSVRYVREQTL